jgi:hypothetical protein
MWTSPRQLDELVAARTEAMTSTMGRVRSPLYLSGATLASNFKSKMAWPERSCERRSAWPRDGTPVVASAPARVGFQKRVAPLGRQSAHGLAQQPETARRSFERAARASSRESPGHRPARNSSTQLRAIRRSRCTPLSVAEPGRLQRREREALRYDGGKATQSRGASAGQPGRRQGAHASELRDCLAVKDGRLGGVLESLERAGRLNGTAAGWRRLD